MMANRHSPGPHRSLRRLRTSRARHSSHPSSFYPGFALVYPAGSQIPASSDGTPVEDGLLCLLLRSSPSYGRNPPQSNDLKDSTNTISDPQNLKVKLVLLGDSGVGKSCIVLRFVRGQFDATSKVTVGASFLSQTIALQDSTTIKFEIWDTAGQERYAALAPLYYRGAAVAVVVYDITNPESFSKAQYWVKELQKHGSPDIILALVGNKADLHENRSVPVQDAVEYAEKNGMFFIETSAKTADNINQLFECHYSLHYNVRCLVSAVRQPTVNVRRSTLNCQRLVTWRPMPNA
ncbi:hypothetical protein Taro_024026 [Colocasia esculenta]|uniref:Uncharacterized protein n=1 Tax=Colocasia esculenta TaxID=4460 RepID=A0A843V861_COLES|nr:hypothetical protein [Colocasia esculenta]